MIWFDNRWLNRLLDSHHSPHVHTHEQGAASTPTQYDKQAMIAADTKHDRRRKLHAQSNA